MNDHLTPEELELLSMNQFHGEGLFEALVHLEKCEQCRSQIQLPSKEEILSRIFDEEDPPLSPPSSKQQQSSPSFKKRESAVNKILEKLTVLRARHN